MRAASGELLLRFRFDLGALGDGIPSCARCNTSFMKSKISFWLGSGPSSFLAGPGGFSEPFFGLSSSCGFFLAIPRRLGCKSACTERGKPNQEVFQAPAHDLRC